MRDRIAVEGDGGLRELLYVLLSVRLVLVFFKARASTGFFEFITPLTAPFYAPFDHIVATNSVDGAPVAWPLVVAILAYVLLHACLRGLLRLVARG
ncbi:MAG: YggT family protein [Polyangiales bacterium]